MSYLVLSSDSSDSKIEIRKKERRLEVSKTIDFIANITIKVNRATTCCTIRINLYITINSQS